MSDGGDRGGQDAARSAQALADLAHDVGKYIARVARNVSPGEPVPPGLIPLLVKDLYERPGSSPRARFEQLHARLSAAAAASPTVCSAAAAIDELTLLEAAVRAGDEAACVRACALARTVDESLRAALSEVAW